MSAVLPTALVLGTLPSLPPIGAFRGAPGESPHYRAVLRAEGGPPWDILAHLDFGYGLKRDEAFAREVVRRWNAHEDLLAACDAGLRYDAVLAKRAKDGTLEHIDAGGAIAEGKDLDTPYEEWFAKATAALAKARA